MKSLYFTGEAIKCRGCQREFEVSRLHDQEQVVMAIESISARHKCPGPARPARPQVRVYQMPSGAGLNLYYAREMQRFSA
jgi:hypothetical protein